jgi:Cu+-exporting ATPase
MLLAGVGLMSPILGGCKPAAAQKADIVYSCPMHPEVSATWEAKCPKCGMALVGAEAKPDKKPAMDYVCPMHPEVKASWEAKCPQCGMALVKQEEKPAP